MRQAYDYWQDQPDISLCFALRGPRFWFRRSVRVGAVDSAGQGTLRGKKNETDGVYPSPPSLPSLIFFAILALARGHLLSLSLRCWFAACYCVFPGPFPPAACWMDPFANATVLSLSPPLKTCVAGRSRVSSSGRRRGPSGGRRPARTLRGSPFVSRGSRGELHRTARCWLAAG